MKKRSPKGSVENVEHRLSTLTSVVFTTVALSSILVAGCGGTTESASISNVAVAPSPALSTWVVMGSSTAAGFGAGPGQRWSDLLQKDVADKGVTVRNIAKAGAVTYQALSTSVAPVIGRPAPDPSINLDYALSFRPSVVFVSFPTNDTVAGYSVNEIVKNLKSIRDGARATGTQVILLSTQPRVMTNIQRQELRLIDEQLSDIAGKCFINVQKALTAPDGTLAKAYDSGDGIHPNNEGHNVIFEAVSTVIEEGICLQK